jgi:hypothetical protein
MIAVIIPTINRFASLISTIATIEKSDVSDNIIIGIIVDGEKYEPYYKKIKNHYRDKKNIKVYINRNRRGWGNSINWSIKYFEADYYVAASDDLLFNKDAIRKAKAKLNKSFPDGDGVIGFNQTNMRHFCPGAFVMIGTKWAQRFPERQIFYPGYIHFCVDSEHWHYAKSKNKFIFAKEAELKHIRKHDECHKLAQKSLNRDRQIWWQKKGNPKRYWPKCQKQDWRTDLGLKKPDPWE